MASNAMIANGFKLQRQDAGTWHDVAEVYNAALGAATAPDIDVTHSQSTRREKRTGLPDDGNHTITMNYVDGDDQQDAMEDEQGQNVVRAYRVVFPNGTRAYGGDWVLKTMSPGGLEVDGKIIRTATFVGAVLRQTVTP